MKRELVGADYVVVLEIVIADFALHPSLADLIHRGLGLDQEGPATVEAISRSILGKILDEGSAATRIKTLTKTILSNLIYGGQYEE